MARREEEEVEREAALVEDALGLRRPDPEADGAGPRDVPSAEPSTAEARALATELAGLARAVTPSAPSDGLRRRVLASARTAGRFEGLFERARTLTGLDDARVHALLAAAEDPAGPGWTDGPGPGVRWHLFEAGPSRDRAPSALVFCEPGATFPEHHHHGRERALVLDGGARDSSGAEWSIGDVVEYPPDTSHSFVTGPRRLVAVVVAQGGVDLPRR